MSYGLGRSIGHIMVSLSYLLLAVSTPKTSILQYVWIVHHPAALAIGMMSNFFITFSLQFSLKSKIEKSKIVEFPKL